MVTLLPNPWDGAKPQHYSLSSVQTELALYCVCFYIVYYCCYHCHLGIRIQFLKYFNPYIHIIPTKFFSSMSIYSQNFYVCLKFFIIKNFLIASYLQILLFFAVSSKEKLLLRTMILTFRYKVIALHSILSTQDQAAAFTLPPQGVRKVKLSTSNLFICDPPENSS